MARIIDYREIPLDELYLNKAQVRQKNAGQGIDELAENIKRVGLLHPIVVCPTERPGMYEILLGQRRFLAHRELQYRTIRCAVFDEQVDAIIAKVISLSENMVRRGLDTKDLIDVCTALYRHYGSFSMVAEETGLPIGEVRKYVKFDQLLPELKQMVSEGEVKLEVALRAQKAASVSGAPRPEEAIMYAKEMQPMSGANQRKLIEEREKNPKAPPQAIIEKAKTGDKLVQVVVTLSETAHRGLQTYARSEGTSQDEAAAVLISDSLQIKGFLEGEDDAE